MTDSRRNFLKAALAGAGAAALSGCTRLSQKPWVQDALGEVENLTRRVQRVFAGGHALATEYKKSDIAPVFRANGTLNPSTDEYAAHAATGFRNWRIAVGGLVEKPLSLSLDDLQAMPARTQITRHDCVEGWSCIGEWTGVPLAPVLAAARPKPEARYVMFFCADPMGNLPSGEAAYYYESLDLLEATHPQTILAYRLNGQVLPIEHGAPVRLRAERQLGYKMAKYIQRIELVENFHRFAGGKGGYWEDQGYSWYAGI
ncbi:MAG: molybdopterin-binding protein [Alphaproteobacteria bacterium]|nr:molybdopterin-binding protein [Alphaproteobacteria bacterium]MBV9692567.1 molybdopterin-binding protein [Alphaproteobacteria bacterium]